MEPDATPTPMRKAVSAARPCKAWRAGSVWASAGSRVEGAGSNGRIAGTIHSAAGARDRCASNRPTTPITSAASSVRAGRLSILIGVELFGFLGALLAIPVAGVFHVIGRDLYDSYRGRLKPEPTTGTDQIPVSRPQLEPGEQQPRDVTAHHTPLT
jgi:hypothetical protein